jgi:hypothetical protein
MEYAANLLSPRGVLIPAIAFVIGAGGAIGVYAALDDTDVNIEPNRVVVADPPAAPSEGVAAKDEAATAAAISGTEPHARLGSRDEPGTAAAAGADYVRRGGGPPAENDDQATANRTDPHGPAAALP